MSNKQKFYSDFIWYPAYRIALVMHIWFAQWWRFDVRWRPLNDNSISMRVRLLGLELAHGHETSTRHNNLRLHFRQISMTVSFIVIMEFYNIDWSAKPRAFRSNTVTSVIIVYPKKRNQIKIAQYVHIADSPKDRTHNTRNGHHHRTPFPAIQQLRFATAENPIHKILKKALLW